jgi:D-glycerate 3-kinase
MSSFRFAEHVAERLVRALHARVPDARRVDGYYAPLAIGSARRLSECPHRPWVLGIQGPQGCGKSTLASALVDAFGDVGLRSAAVSIDDFYLTHAEQLALAERHKANPYLLYRGYPGTHDVALGARMIESIVRLRPGEEALVPAYVKSAHGGRGDRAPRSDWRRVVGPIDALFVEGWMLGFSPVDDATIEPELRAPNALLAAYASWTDSLDSFVHLDVASLDAIVSWRIDAERARRALGHDALSDDEARDYIERFLPAYRAYLPRLRARPPSGDVRTIELAPDRMPVLPLRPS